MTLLVGNLPVTTTAAALRQMCAAYGRVAHVHIVTDWDTGRSWGYGFVDMPNPSEARAAIAGLQGTILGGRAVSVNAVQSPQARQKPRRRWW